MSNQFPFFVGAKLRFVGAIGDVLFPSGIVEDLSNGLVVEIAGYTVNDHPYFIHNLGINPASDFRWSITGNEASFFEVVNEQPEPLRVKDLHPKDIALVQAIHIVHRTQQRMSNGCSVDEAGVSHSYLVGNLLERSVEAVKALQDYGEDLMQDLTINYNLKEVK